ncbi:MAG: mechanosensitive ion channel family protein [Actinomycetes bacterium]
MIGVVLAAAAPDGACGAPDAQASLCRFVYDATGSEGVARAVDLLSKPLRIIGILLVAWVVSRVARLFIRRFVRRATAEGTGRIAALSQRTGLRALAPETARERSEQRAATMSTVLRSVVALLVWGTALVMCLDVLGVNLATLGVSVGIVGAALAFGSQALVRDLVTGTFMLVEDQYGVGDVVDLGEAVGTVENVTLRLTRVRDIDGVVWHVPNGEIRRVGNKSQGWAVVNVDVPLAGDVDLDAADACLQAAAAALMADGTLRPDLLAPPEVLGVESMTAERVVVRVSVRTNSAQQWRVARALRGEVKAALEAAGIAMGSSIGLPPTK